MMLKVFLSLAIVGAFALSGCSQTKAEVKVPVEAKVVKPIETKATTVVEKVVEKVAPTINGGVSHIPFSEMIR